MKESCLNISFDIFQRERKHFYHGDSIALFYVVSGTVSIEYQRQQKKYSPGALLAANPGDWCFCDARDGAFLVLKLPLNYLRRIGILTCRRLSLDVPDDSPGTKREFYKVRKALANLWQDCFQESGGPAPSLEKEVLEFFTLLRHYFSGEMEDDIFRTEEDEAGRRLGQTVSYIHDHWAEDLCVADLAKLSYVSPNYLSRLWKNAMGCTLLAYICDVRLDYGEKQLHGSHSITEIASLCGFKNTHAFNKNFYRQFGVMPKQYRENLRRKEKQVPVSVQEGGLDLTELLSYADALPAAKSVRTERRELVIDADETGIPLRHTWRRLVNIGYARDGLVEAVQRQLLLAQREIGFEYVRFHGIFDDDMHLFSEDENGELRPNYIFVDMLFDFFLSIGLKPFVEFGYVPRALAVRPLRVLERETYFSRVKDEAKWCALIRHFLEHILARYGKAAVLTWRFTVGGSELKLQGYLSGEEYLAHYLASFRAVKSVCPSLMVGGFGGHSSLILEVEEFKEFVEFTMEEGCVPDFFCIQNFPVEYVKKEEPANPILLSKLSPVTISGDVHYSRNLLKKTREILAEYGLSDKEIWFEEWNASIWQRDAANDTCYKAAWIIKDICENYDRAEAFGYWLLTDFIEERLPNGSLAYFGGSSLITYNGIPKAGWNAMRLLRKLGDTCLASGDGYFVTRKDHKLQILLYQYVHYASLYRFCSQTPIHADRAYDIFLNRADRSCQIRVRKREGSSCRIRKYPVDREKGSSFDQWVRMGKPKNLEQEEIAYLKACSVCGLSVSEEDTAGEVVIDVTLSAHACVLYELS